ncbi:MAG: cell division protein ZapA [Rickettsiales bacterium]|jgi:cell division protein ZapA (FtsZ GTPase activity inhibitor)|nr:cell division protein ZapA [Rickettsiales bacterium]
MNIVEIEVGNKKYKISCNEGEDNHLIELSELINDKCVDLFEKFGPKADRELIFIIMLLVLQDEVFSLKKQYGKNNNTKSTIDNSIQKIDSLLSYISVLQNKNN